MSQRPVTEARTAFLMQVVGEMGQGRILVPRFQRRQRWKLEQRLDLLRSLKDNLPIGALLFWRTRSDLIARARLGPYEAPPAKTGAQPTYILDGLQRLETLFAVLHPRGEEPLPREWRIVYDLESEDFRFPRGSDGEMPLDVIQDGLRLLAFQRTIQGKHPNASRWTERADALAQTFRYIQVPVITLETDDLETATTAFERINSRGTKMGRPDMLAALSWSPTFDLHGTLARHRAVLDPLGWGDLDDDTIIDVVLHSAGLSLGKRNVDAGAKRIKEMGNALPNALEDIKRAIGFLAEHLGVYNSNQLPYRMQLVMLAEALTKPNPDEKGLIQWFWWSTFRRSFAGISGDLLDRMAAYVRALGEGGYRKWPGRSATPDLPAKYDTRSAFSRGVALLMLANQADDDARRELGSMGAGAWRKLEASQPRRLGNLLLVSPHDEPRLRARIASGTLAPIDAAPYILTNKVLPLLRERKFDEAIAEREKQIEQLVNGKLKAVGMPRGLGAKKA